MYPRFASISKSAPTPLDARKAAYPPPNVIKLSAVGLVAAKRSFARIETTARPMQCEIRCKSRSLGLDTAFRAYGRSLPALTSARFLNLMTLMQAQDVCAHLPTGDYPNI